MIDNKKLSGLIEKQVFGMIGLPLRHSHYPYTGKSQVEAARNALENLGYDVKVRENLSSPLGEKVWVKVIKRWDGLWLWAAIPLDIAEKALVFGELPKIPENMDPDG